MTGSELDDERSFLLDSLQDLERERDAGDLSDADYGALRDHYTRRAADVLRAIERAENADRDLGRPHRADLDRRASPRAVPSDAVSSDAVSSGAGIPAEVRSPRRRRALLVAGSTALVAAAVVAVVTQTGARLPGQTVSGAVSLSSAAQLRRTLAQAETLERAGDGPGALRLYHQVLAQNPRQGEALAESGWLEFQAGVQARDAAVLSAAQQLEQEAQRAEPGAYAPRLYLGSMFLAEGNVTGAVAQYRQFLADGPPPSATRAAQPYIKEAFTKAGLPVPSLPDPSSTPTTAATPTTRVPPAG
jgi:tetratricopeptide (TPR) repeat protein